MKASDKTASQRFARNMICTLILVLSSFIFPSAFSSTASAVTFNMVQFNTWQFKFLGIDLTKDGRKRLEALPDALAKTGADVITLEEVWSNGDKKYLAKQMAQRGYLYSSYTVRILSQGDGLLLLSRYPIVSVEKSKPFQPKTVILDTFTRKRAVHLVIDFPTLGHIDVYGTHLGPVDFYQASDSFNDAQQERLKGQMVQLADFIQSTRISPYTFMGGDLNTNYLTYGKDGTFKPEFSKSYLALVNHACGRQQELQNSFLNANHLTAQDPIVPTFSQKNHYLATQPFGKMPDEVEDYLFYCPNEAITPAQSKIIFRDDILLSDHYGIQTTYEIKAPVRPFIEATESEEQSESD